MSCLQLRMNVCSVQKFCPFSIWESFVGRRFVFFIKSHTSLWTRENHTGLCCFLISMVWCFHPSPPAFWELCVPTLQHYATLYVCVEGKNFYYLTHTGAINYFKVIFLCECGGFMSLFQIMAIVWGHLFLSPLPLWKYNWSCFWRGTVPLHFFTINILLRCFPPFSWCALQGVVVVIKHFLCPDLPHCIPILVFNIFRDTNFRFFCPGGPPSCPSLLKPALMPKGFGALSLMKC